MNKDTLLKLAEACEQASGADRMLDWKINVALGVCPDRVPSVTELAHDIVTPRFTASIDAALTLVPEGWEWAAGFEDGGAFAHVHRQGSYGGIVDATTPALALCAASLRALAQGGEG